MGRLIDEIEIYKRLRPKVDNGTLDDIMLDIPTVEAIPKDQYENRLRADMVAILTELQLEIEELEMGDNVPFGFEPVNKFYEGVSASSKVIQQKIDALKADKERNEKKHKSDSFS